MLWTNKSYFEVFLSIGVILVSLPGSNKSKVGAGVHRHAVHFHLAMNTTMMTRIPFVSFFESGTMWYLLEDNSGPHDSDASDEKKSSGTVEVIHPPWHWLLDCLDISIFFSSLFFCLLLLYFVQSVPSMLRQRCLVWQYKWAIQHPRLFVFLFIVFLLSFCFLLSSI